MCIISTGLPIDAWGDFLTKEVTRFRTCTFAESTKNTYRTHLLTYLQFCLAFGYLPAPVSQEALLRYAALLAQSLSFQSIRQYLNIIRLLHLEMGLPNPLEHNWGLQSLLQGVSRSIGQTQFPKSPITPTILLQIRPFLFLDQPLDCLFWAATLTGFFGMLRKSNLLPTSDFDPVKHLSRDDFKLHSWGISVKILWSKTIQFGQRDFVIALPLINNSPLCPVSAIGKAFSLAPALSKDPAFSFRTGGKLQLLTYSKFLQKFRQVLSRAGLPASDYAAHSLHRGGGYLGLQMRHQE